MQNYEFLWILIQDITVPSQINPKLHRPLVVQNKFCHIIKWCKINYRVQNSVTLLGGKLGNNVYFNTSAGKAKRGNSNYIARWMHAVYPIQLLISWTQYKGEVYFEATKRWRTSVFWTGYCILHVNVTLKISGVANTISSKATISFSKFFYRTSYY